MLPSLIPPDPLPPPIQDWIICPYCLQAVGTDAPDLYRHLNVDHWLTRRESDEVARQYTQKGRQS